MVIHKLTQRLPPTLRGVKQLEPGHPYSGLQLLGFFRSKRALPVQEVDGVAFRDPKGICKK